MVHTGESGKQRQRTRLGGPQGRTRRGRHWSSLFSVFLLIFDGKGRQRAYTGDFSKARRPTTLTNMAFTSRFKPTRFTAANANTTNSEASFQIPSSALANWDAQDYLLADVDDDDLDFLKAGDFTLSTPTPASRRASLASARGRKEEEGKADEGRVEEEEAEVETTPVARRVSRVSVGLGASTASGNRTTAALHVGERNNEHTFGTQS